MVAIVLVHHVHVRDDVHVHADVHVHVHVHDDHDHAHHVQFLMKMIVIENVIIVQRVVPVHARRRNRRYNSEELIPSQSVFHHGS
eukprot:CAMPEP_0170820210 /NCGR_PEP_ID=MMETSP0733-20121128/42136_1 /TAXON_ID=186038 /ORGANISM="Fragilariopsis kerguelensis, Strain L26-C5" /LENGTH=84 /DNA_ID=CAMNT_0011181351 /DNA_START=249 /DNA_END=503 /DNA_ORIENTATION=-